MWYTSDEAANQLKLTPKHVRELLQKGKIEGHKTQVGWIVDPKSVVTYIPDKGGRPKKIKRKYTRNNPVCDSI